MSSTICSARSFLPLSSLSPSFSAASSSSKDSHRHLQVSVISFLLLTTSLVFPPLQVPLPSTMPSGPQPEVKPSSPPPFTQRSQQSAPAFLSQHAPPSLVYRLTTSPLSSRHPPPRLSPPASPNANPNTPVTSPPTLSLYKEPPSTLDGGTATTRP